MLFHNSNGCSVAIGFSEVTHQKVKMSVSHFKLTTEKNMQLIFILQFKDLYIFSYLCDELPHCHLLMYRQVQYSRGWHFSGSRVPQEGVRKISGNHTLRLCQRCVQILARVCVMLITLSSTVTFTFSPAVSDE